MPFIPGGWCHTFLLGIVWETRCSSCATLVENSTCHWVGSFLLPSFSWSHQVNYLTILPSGTFVLNSPFNLPHMHLLSAQDI